MSSQRYLSAIEACNTAMVACEACTAACLSGDDSLDLDICINLTRDCADICRLASRLMERESALVDEVCRLCAVTSQACAEECAKYKVSHCQQCVHVCQRCVEQCEAVTETGEAL